MNPFLPSEIARLVLGYLKEEGCTASYKAFLQESTHLQEFVLLLRSGQEYPTSIGGRSLKIMLNEYGRLVISGQTQSSDTLVTAWNRFNLEVAQLQHLTAVLCTGGSNLSASNSFQQNAHKRTNITRRALNSREKNVLPTSNMCVPVDYTRICTASAPMVLSGNNSSASAAYPAVLVPSSSDGLQHLQTGAVDSANITQLSQLHYASTRGNVGNVPSTPQCQLVKLAPFSPHVMLVNADSNVSRLSTVSGSTRSVCSQNPAASETCTADKQMLPSTSFSLPLDNSMLLHSAASSSSHNRNIHPEQIFSPRLGSGHETQQIFVNVPVGSPVPDCRRTASNVNENSCPSFLTLLNGAGDSVADGYCSNTAADNNIPSISVATSSTGLANNTVIAAGSCQQHSVVRESWKHRQKEDGSCQQLEPTDANRTAHSDMLVIREGEMSCIENSDGESDGGIVDVDDTQDLVDNVSEVGETSGGQLSDQLQPSTPLKSFNDSRRKPFKSPRRKCLMPKRKISPEPASDNMPLGSASCVAVSSRLSIASAACSSSKSSLPIFTIAEKLADNTELAQRIAENINQHRLKADGSVSVSGSGSLLGSHTSGLGDESTTSVLHGDSVRCCKPTNRKKTLTSTADLSINEDSLMAALEEICTSVFSDNSLVDLSNVLSHDVRMELDAELEKIGSFPTDRVAEYALSDFHSELIASASNSSSNLLIADAEIDQQQGTVRGIPCPDTVTVQSSSNALLSSQTVDCSGGTIRNDSTGVVSIETNVPLCQDNNMPLASCNNDVASTRCIDSVESDRDHRLDNRSTTPAGVSTSDQDGEVEIATCTVADAVPHCEQIDMVQELDYGHAPTPSSSTPLDPSRPLTACTVPESSVCRQNLQNFVCDKSAIISDTSQLNITDARPISDNSNIDAVPSDFVDTAVNVEPSQFSSTPENNNKVGSIVCVTNLVQPPVSQSSNADGMLIRSETVLAVGSKNKTIEGGRVKRIITSEIPSKEGAELIPVVYVNSEGVPICIEVLQPVSQFPQPLDHVLNGVICLPANKELVERDLTLIANQCKSRKHRLLERRLTGSDQVEAQPSDNIATVTPAAAGAAINSIAIAAPTPTSAPGTGTGTNYDHVTTDTTTDAPDRRTISAEKPMAPGKVTQPRSKSGTKPEHSRTAHSVHGSVSEKVHSSKSGGPSAASEERAESKVSMKSKSQRASSTARHSKLRLRDTQRQQIAGRSHQLNQKPLEAVTADIAGKKVSSPHKEIHRQPGAILSVPTASPVKSANETSPGLTYSNMPDLCAACLLASLSSTAVKVLGSDNQVNDPCMAAPESAEPKVSCVSTFEQINLFINENYGVRGGLSQNSRPQANREQLKTPRVDGSVKKPNKTSRKVASQCANPVLSDVLPSSHSMYQKNAAEESTSDLHSEVGDHSESQRSVLESAKPSGTMGTKQRHEILAAPNSVVCGRRTVPASPSSTLSSADTVQSTAEALDLSQPRGRKRQRTLSSSSSSSSSDNEPLCVIVRRLKTDNSDHAQSLRKPSRQNPSRKSVRLENESKRRRTTSPKHSPRHDGGSPSPNHCNSIKSDGKKSRLKPVEHSEQLSKNCAVKLPVQVKRSPARKSQNETEKKQNDAVTSRNIFQAAGSDSFCKQNVDIAAISPTVVVKSQTSLPSISCFVNKRTACEVDHTSSLPGSESASHCSTSVSEVLSSECIVDLSLKNSCNKDGKSFSTEHCPSARTGVSQSSEDPLFYDASSMVTAEPEDHANTNVTEDNPSSAETLSASIDSAAAAAAAVIKSPTCQLDQSASIGVVLHIPDASVAACDSLLADFESSTDDAERTMSLPSEQPIDGISQKAADGEFRENDAKTDVGLLPTAQTGASVTPAHPVNVVVQTSSQGLAKPYSEPRTPKDQANPTSSQSLAEPDSEPHPTKRLAPTSSSTKTTTTHLHLPNLNQFKIAEKLTPENISRILALARK